MVCFGFMIYGLFGIALVGMLLRLRLLVWFVFELRCLVVSVSMDGCLGLLIVYCV